MALIKKTLAGKRWLGVIAVVVFLIGLAAIIRAEKAPQAETRQIEKVVKVEKADGRGFLGVQVEALTDEELDSEHIDFGVYVRSVEKGEAAEQAGIKKGDIIQYVGNDKIRNTSALIKVIRAREPGEKVKIKLIRNEKPMELTATLGKAREIHKEVFMDSETPEPPEMPDMEKIEKELDIIKEKDGNRMIFFGERGFVGVSLQALNDDLAPYFGVPKNGGALVLKVEKDSPAEKGGIKSGDVITQIGKEKVSNPEDAIRALEKFKKGDQVDISFIRKHQSQKTQVQLREAPEFRQFKFMHKSANPSIPSCHIHIPEINIDIPEIHLEKLSRLLEMGERGHRHQEIMLRTQEKMKAAQEKVKEIDFKKIEEKMKKKQVEIQKKIRQKMAETTACI